MHPNSKKLQASRSQGQREGDHCRSCDRRKSKGRQKQSQRCGINARYGHDGSYNYRQRTNPKGVGLCH